MGRVDKFCLLAIHLKACLHGPTQTECGDDSDVWLVFTVDDATKFIFFMQIV